MQGGTTLATDSEKRDTKISAVGSLCQWPSDPGPPSCAKTDGQAQSTGAETALHLMTGQFQPPQKG